MSKNLNKKFYPLSKSEEGIYLSCTVPTDAYNLSNYLLLDNDIDLNLFKDAIRKVFSNHPYLNTVLSLSSDGSIVKSIEEDEVVINDIHQDDTYLVPSAPFEMLNKHLYRLDIIHYKDELYFHFDIHHIIFDGFSIKLFIDEVIDIYNGSIGNIEKKSANDYSLLEKKALSSDFYLESKAFYESKLGGVDCDSSIVEDGFNPKEDSLKNKKLEILLNIKNKDVKEYISKLDIKMSSFFISLFGLLVSKVNMDEEFLISTVNNGRQVLKNDDFLKSFGMFVKTYLIYGKVDNEEKIKDYLKRLNKDLIDSVINSLYSYSDCVSDLGVSSDILFAYQGDFMYKTKYHDRDLIAQDRHDGKGKMAIELFRTGESFKLWVEYRPDLYDESTIRTLMHHFNNLLKNVLSNKYDLLVKDISLIDDEELKILNDYNKVNFDYIDLNRNVLVDFKEVVKKYPNNLCVVFKDKKYTYKEVDEISNKLARKLIENGAKSNKVVSTLIKKNEFVVIASLGVLKSGAAYQPLDPNYPKDRLNFMVKDSNAIILIRDDDLDGIIDDFKGEVIKTSEIIDLDYDCKELEIKTKKNDLFIMLYTSGTTGLPKGVMLEHQNIYSFAKYYAHNYEVTSSSKSAAYASYGFDANLMDLYPHLITGGCVYIIPEEMRLDLVKLGKYFDEVGITHTLLTTQVGRQFVEGIDTKTLKHLFVGGEKLVPVVNHNSYVLHNVYGPTEGTVFCTHQIVDKMYRRVPIGKCNENYKVYCLDKYGNLLPRMVKGELYISGPQVGRGYLNRDKENKEAFLENKFDNDPLFSRLYKTGDIVRLLEDGVVDFIGRNDGQVKIRGFRVELTEVEKVIRSFKGIKDATVKDFTDPSGIKFICAYIVSDSEVNIDELNEFIKETKPAYMVPAYTMQLDKIPLNQNSKVDKRALPKPELKAKEIVEPKNDTEKKIYKILENIVGHSSFGTTTDFYEAGLSSVSSIKFVINLSKEFNVSIENKNILENNNVQKLSEFISKLDNSNVAFEKQDTYPITKTQQGIFIESVAKPNSTNYNIPYLFEIGNKFDIDKLERAVINTINNHPYLKMHLIMDDAGDILASRQDDNDINIKRLTISKNNVSIDELRETLIQPFNLLGGDLYRVIILTTLDNNYLYLDFHHIICDGTSEAIILNDISEFYSGKKTELDKDDFEFSGFEVALAELEELKTDKLTKAKEFYHNILKDVDGEYSFKKDLKVAEASLLKSVDLKINVNYDKLNKFISDNKISYNGLFNFAFAYVLSKFIYKKESLYVTIYNGRSNSMYQHIVSMLVKTLPVYIKYDSNDEIISKLKETSELLINLQANDLYAFSDISNDYDISSDMMFIYQGDLFKFDKIGGIDVKPIMLESDTPKTPFSQEVFLNDKTFVNHFEVDEAIYNMNTVNAIHRLYELVLNELLDKKYIKDINTLPSVDRELYAEFNDTKLEIPNVSFNKLVEKAVANNLDKIAIVGDDVFKEPGEKIEISYNDFNRMANKVAWTLVHHGLVREDKVVMMMPRVAQAYVVRQGIIKSSGAFVPVDPKYPLDRVEYIIYNSSSKFLISTKKILEGYKELIDKYKLYAFAIEDIINSNEFDYNLDLDIPSDSLCYIIYTSGSTGKPKGVMINHHNLVNYCLDGNNCLTKEYRIIEEGAVGCSFSSFAFDASLQEECIPLSHGYRAVIASSEEIENPLLLAKTLVKYKVNIMFLTPSFVTNMIEVDEFVEALKGFKVLDMGAESVPMALCERLRKLGITATLNNGYGPTETTITCTMHEVHDKYMTIGKPAINTKLFILDKDDNILPINAIGNLTIGGDLVGRGYLGLEEKTKESFIEKEFNGEVIRCYKSGDLARYNNDGNIEFFGRLDNQVKLRGLRVELDEIEKVLNSYPLVSRSIILVKNGAKEGDYLVAYYTGKGEIDKEDLTQHLQKSLTPYMVPKVLVQLEKFPLNASGKIDKKALPEVNQTEEKERKIRKPVDKLEENLVEIFSKALGLEEISTDDDFFDLGGTSLSASKVAMLAFKYNLPIVYKDVFDYSSVLEMKKMIEDKTGVVSSKKDTKEPTSEVTKEEVKDICYEALKFNTVANVNDITNTYEYNEYLLTGGSGFLGIHILKELLDQKKKVNLLVKSGKIDARSKLYGLLAFYFDSPMIEVVEKYVNIIDCDITSDELFSLTKDLHFDCIINCAAIVKHFSNDNSIEIVNVGGVEKLIKIALEKKCMLVHISTLSVAGENVNNKFDPSFRMKEDMLEFGQDISNKYVNSKYKAEKLILENIMNNGLTAKVVRVGNLMGRNSDGEFQANSITNGFMRDLKSYAIIGKFPVNSMDFEVDFSPIDEVSRAVLALSRTDKKFTMFHCANSHQIQMGDVIDCMNELGFNISIVSDEEFNSAMIEMMADEKKNMLVASLINYSSSSDEVRSFILTNNEFTNKALYHLGFKWPITDYKYLKNAIDSLLTLGFFDYEEE